MLRRSDCPLFKFHVGADYEEVALALGTGHAFVVDVLLVLPRIAPEAPDVFHAYVHEKAEPLLNGWFRTGSQGIERILSALIVSCYEHNPIASHPRDGPLQPAVVPHPAKPQEAELTIWDFVEACETPHADTAAAIRSHLERAVGKVGAAEMLREAHGTSSRDQADKKQRILSIDGKAIRIKKE